MQKNIKKVFSASIITLLLVQMVYVAIEPSVVVAATASDPMVVNLNVDAGISISAPADVTMNPLGSVSAASTNSATPIVWTVITNNDIGYNLSVKASASPALVSGGNSFADYTEASAGVPEVWNVPSGNKEFGFTAYGANTATGTWGTTASCGTTTVPNASMKYVGFKTTDKIIATLGTPTAYAGVATTLCLAAEQDTLYAPSGTYLATVTATATTI